MRQMVVLPISPQSTPRHSLSHETLRPERAGLFLERVPPIQGVEEEECGRQAANHV